MHEKKSYRHHFEDEIPEDVKEHFREARKDPARPLEVRMEAREGRSADFHARALGLLGLGREAEARTALASALDADPDDVGAVVLRRSLAPTGRTAAREARP